MYTYLGSHNRFHSVFQILVDQCESFIRFLFFFLLSRCFPLQSKIPGDFPPPGIFKMSLRGIISS